MGISSASATPACNSAVVKLSRRRCEKLWPIAARPRRVFRISWYGPRPTIWCWRSISGRCWQILQELQPLIIGPVARRHRLDQIAFLPVMPQGTSIIEASFKSPSLCDDPCNPACPNYDPAGSNCPSVALLAVRSSASYAPGPIAPGQIVSVFGTNVGPSTVTTLQQDPSGDITTTLAGTTVYLWGTITGRAVGRRDAPFPFAERGSVRRRHTSSGSIRRRFPRRSDRSAASQRSDSV
jgi:hypothetical protein